MKTPINKKSFEDRLVERNKIDVGFYSSGFFSFIRFRDNIHKTIANISCQNAYKLFYISRSLTGPNAGEDRLIKGEYGYDFCFEDDLPIISGDGKIYLIYIY